MVDIFTAKPTPEPTATTTAVPVKNEAIPSEPAQSPHKASMLPSGGKPGVLTAYLQTPQNTSFASENPGEEIYLLLRRHFITNTPWILTTILLLFVPLLFPILFHISNPFLLFLPNGIPGNYALIYFIFYYLAVLSISFVYFLSWYYSISLITSEQVYDIDFSSLVYREISATRIHLVEDVTATQVGSLRSFFDYGEVLVQTAGTLDNFDLTAVPHPTKVANLIEDLLGKEEEEQEDKENDHD